jgi:hypothetical protein
VQRDFRALQNERKEDDSGDGDDGGKRASGVAAKGNCKKTLDRLDRSHQSMARDDGEDEKKSSTAVG